MSMTNDELERSLEVLDGILSETVLEVGDLKRAARSAEQLTKRERFAMAAMQGMLAAEHWDNDMPWTAVEVADALIVALAKGAGDE